MLTILKLRQGVDGKSKLKFWKNLAVQMLESNIDNKLFHGSPKKARSTKARVSIFRGGDDHGVMNRPYFTSEWLRKSLKRPKKSITRPTPIMGINAGSIADAIIVKQCPSIVTISHFDCIMLCVLLA